MVSTAEVPTGQMVVDTGKHFPATGQVMSAVEGSVRSARFLDAAGLARQLFDDEQYANMLLVGVAYQAGALPIGAEAIEHAIRLNGVAVETNIAAFRRGGLSVSGPGGAAAAAARKTTTGRNGRRWRSCWRCACPNWRPTRIRPTRTRTRT